MKRNITLCAGVTLCAGILAFAVAASAPGLAQPAPPPYAGAVYPGYGPALPPYEVNAVVRSTGLEPLGPPMRQGPAYAVRALDPDGGEVRVIVDAHMGRIIKVIPITGPRYAVVPPSGRPPGRIAIVPDGYGPNARMGPPPPGVEGRPPSGPAGASPPGPASAAGAPYDPASQPTRPPLPRPRPKVAATEAPAAQPVAGAVTAPASPPPAAVEMHE